MESEDVQADDVIKLPASSDSGPECQNNEHPDSENGQHEVNSGNCDPKNRERSVDMEEDMDLTEDDFRTVHGQFVGVTEQVNDVIADSSAVQVSVETVTVVDKKLGLQNETLIHSTTMDSSSKSGVKRPRTTCDGQQPSVHVTYKHLTRVSKQKLEQLLQQWSKWQAEHGSSTQDQVLEFGEETYFPALRVGSGKKSSVSFLIDNQTGDKQVNGFVPVDSSTVPLYDRGFALGLTSADGSNNLEGGLEIIDDPPRCFNCGSYSHSLRECPKPRDNAAVNSARKQQKAKRNQNSASRVPIRYYQNSQGGKYDGLRPGVLGAETRQLLGLGELDPPPWLSRMKEIGYPPGYLDDENRPSGITIFGDEDNNVKEEETEDGEILEKENLPEPPKKMTVEFPGINAPIPENADEKLWAPGPSPSSDQQRNRWQHRSNRGYYLHDPRSPSFREYRDDGPPGVEPSSYPPRYDYSYGSKDYIPRPRSPTLERSQSDRSRRSEYASHDSYGYSRYSSSSSSRQREYDLDFRDRDDHDSHRHRSNRK